MVRYCILLPLPQPASSVQCRLCWSCWQLIVDRTFESRTQPRSLATRLPADGCKLGIKHGVVGVARQEELVTGDQTETVYLIRWGYKVGGSTIRRSGAVLGWTGLDWLVGYHIEVRTQMLMYLIQVPGLLSTCRASIVARGISRDGSLSPKGHMSVTCHSPRSQFTHR